MKITTLLETMTTPSSDPAGNQSQQAPKFGRDPHVLETTTSGAVATVSQPVGGVQKRGKGSIFQGVKTSKKFANSVPVKESRELYGLRVGDTVKTVINGRPVQGDILDIFPDTMEVELLLRGPESGKTVTVDVRDTEALDEAYGSGTQPPMPTKEVYMIVNTETMEPVVHYDDVESAKRDATALNRKAGQKIYTIQKKTIPVSQFREGVAEGLPQTLRKVVPGHAKREIDKKMDAGKFGKTDADKDANFHRYKKIQDKLKESEQVFKVIAVDKSNYLGGKEEMTVKADSIEDLFSRLSANDWYPLEINGVEVIAGKRLKQGVAEGVTPASVSKVLRLVQRHKPEWFDNYGMGEVEDTVVDMAEMGQFQGMSAVDALALVGQELESLYGQQGMAEAGSPAQQAAIAIAMKKADKKPKSKSVEEEKQRLDAKCWSGYKKQGTKMKGGVRVNNCVPAESVSEEKVEEIKANPEYMRAAERSRSVARDTQRSYYASPEEKAKARKTELKRDKGIAGYSKRHRKEHPEMYPKITPRPAPKLRDPSTEYSDDYSVWAKGRRDTIDEAMRMQDYLDRAEELHKQMLEANRKNDTAEFERLKKERDKLDAMARQGMVAESDISEDIIAQKLYKELDAILGRAPDKEIGNKPVDKELGKRPKDKEVVTKEENNPDNSTAKEIAKELHQDISDLHAIKSSKSTISAGHPHNVKSLQDSILSLNNDLNSLGYKYDPKSPGMISKIA